MEGYKHIDQIYLLKKEIKNLVMQLEDKGLFNDAAEIIFRVFTSGLDCINDYNTHRVSIEIEAIRKEFCL